MIANNRRFDVTTRDHGGGPTDGGIQVLRESYKNLSIEEAEVEMHDPNVIGFAKKEHKRGGRR